jgi:hypothetical protein
MQKFVFYSAFCILHSALVFVTPCAAQRPRVPGGLKQIAFALHDLPDRAYGQQTDAFRRLLFEFGFQPLKDFDQLRGAEPSKSLLIVLGDPQCLSRDHFPNGLQSFVQQGGAVLIATDKETGGEAEQILNELARVRVTGETLICRRRNAADVYCDSEYCPIVQPAAASAALMRSTAVPEALATLVGAGGRPDLFRNPRPDRPALRVATNAPSRLKTSGWWLPGGIHRLANLSRFCEDVERAVRPLGLSMHPGKKPEEPREEPLFAVGGTLGQGRVLVLADHSIFINRMILPRDNGNLEFSANCLHWLRGGVTKPLEVLHAANNPQDVEKLTGQRDQVLFWDDGTIRRDFDVPLKAVPIKPSLDMAPAVVAALDRAVTRMEDEDVFNRTLRERMEEMPGGRSLVARNAVYALTLAAILLLGYLFLWRGRHRHESAVPLLAHAVSQHEPKASLLEQRRRALLRSDNVWEMAHQLARQYFESAGIPLTGNAAPRVATRGSWRQRWRVRRRVARLWELARGQAPARIAPAALNRWLRELEELKTALANGTIQLT